MLGSIDKAKVVCARLLVLESNGEQLLGEARFDRVEPSLLRLRPYSIDSAERKADEAVIFSILTKLR